VPKSGTSPAITINVNVELKLKLNKVVVDAVLQCGRCLASGEFFPSPSLSPPPEAGHSPFRRVQWGIRK